MSELGKKVIEYSDWLFEDNIVSRINQIKAKQQGLRSDGFNLFQLSSKKGLNNILPDKILSQKLVILLLLLGGQRMNTYLILK